MKGVEAIAASAPLLFNGTHSHVGLTTERHRHDWDTQSVRARNYAGDAAASRRTSGALCLVQQPDHRPGLQDAILLKARHVSAAAINELLPAFDHCSPSGGDLFFVA